VKTVKCRLNAENVHFCQNEENRTKTIHRRQRM